MNIVEKTINKSLNPTQKHRNRLHVVKKKREKEMHNMGKMKVEREQQTTAWLRMSLLLLPVSDGRSLTAAPY